MSRFWFLVALSLLGSVSALAQKYDISVSEFDFGGKTYSRIVVEINPLANPRQTGEEGYESFAREMYVLRVLESIQAGVARSYRNRGRTSKDKVDAHVLHSLIADPNLLSHPSLPYDEKNGVSRDRNRDLVNRPGTMIAIAEGNDLTRIVASVKIVQSDFVRSNYVLFSQTDLPKLNVGELVDINQEMKDHHQRVYEVENLFMKRGNLDFFEVLVRTMIKHDVFRLRDFPDLATIPKDLQQWEKPNFRVEISCDKNMRGPYEAMGFWPRLQSGDIFNMHMDARDFASNLERFLAGEIIEQHGDSWMSDRNVKTAKLFQRARMRKTPVRPGAYRVIPLEFSSEGFPTFEEVMLEGPALFLKNPKGIGVGATGRCGRAFVRSLAYY